MNRSSNSRIWKEARTRIAISSSLWPARCSLRIPGAGDSDLLARLVLGAQRLAEPALVVGDEMRCRAQDMRGRAIVALQADHHGAREVVLEAQDVVDLRAAPSIDRLVVVADAADVLRQTGRGRLGGGALSQEAQPEILRHIGVLVLVDQDEFEARLILAQHLVVAAEQADAFEQEIAEIGGVEYFQPFLIGRIKLAPLAVGEACAFSGGHLVGREPAIFPV